MKQTKWTLQITVFYRDILQSQNQINNSNRDPCLARDDVQVQRNKDGEV